jgi:transposase
LARLGIRDFKTMLRNASQRLETVRTPEGAALPPNTLAELRRDMARLSFIKQQIKEVETARLERLQRAPGEGGNAMVRTPSGPAASGKISSARAHASSSVSVGIAAIDRPPGH